MDADYARNRQADGSPFRSFEHALFVLAGVMSKPVPDRAIVDAGHKSASVDSGMPVPFQREGAIYTKPSDEHGILTGDLALAKRYLDLGATFVAIGNDVTLLANATTKLLADFKAAEAAAHPGPDSKVY